MKQFSHVFCTKYFFLIFLYKKYVVTPHHLPKKRGALKCTQISFLRGTKFTVSHTYSCGVSLIGVVGSKTISFRINNYSSIDFLIYSLGRISSTSIDFFWTLWASLAWVSANCSSFITTLADSTTVLVLRLYTLYALLDVEYLRENPLSLVASNFSRFSWSQRM